MDEESKEPTRDSSGRFVPKDEPADDDAAAKEGAKVAAEGSGALPEHETAMERVERLAAGDLKEGEWIEDISDTVAPSVGPKSVAFHHAPHEPRDNIDLDAMGNDKRRQVVGKSYGASFAKQATIYGIFVAIVVALVIGGKILISKADQAPKMTDQAPWSAPSAIQHPPKPLE